MVHNFNDAITQHNDRVNVTAIKKSPFSSLTIQMPLFVRYSITGGIDGGETDRERKSKRDGDQRGE